jgi:hypothetical protein
MDANDVSRRGVLGGGLAITAPARAAATSEPLFEFNVAEAERILARYATYGDKASGGPGDNASGAWLESELEGLGYACRRQIFDVPAYEGAAPTLTTGAARGVLIPQAAVVVTGEAGVSGPLRLALEGVALDGALALIVLPYGRWSSVRGGVERQVRRVIAAGAVGAVLVTTGPTGEAIALNAPAEGPAFDRPVAVLAPREAAPFVEAARRGDTASLHILGRAFRREAFNVTATLAGGRAKTLVISTPRSGWFGCMGERGPGLAVWRMLAEWAIRANLPVNIALVATSGHEYENVGGEHFIHELAPKPAAAALWVHLGAAVAARDWHERGPALSPLPSADPQRILMASPALLNSARGAFKGQPSLEAVYPAQSATAAGELGVILRAGYDPAIGVFGSHRFHHARGDDLRCVSAELIPAVARAFARTIQATLAAA